jgi:hypothetical protein
LNNCLELICSYFVFNKISSVTSQQQPKYVQLCTLFPYPVYKFRTATYHAH